MIRRPSIFLGIIVLGIVCWICLLYGATEIAGVAVGGICTILPKILESEEKTING